MADHDEKNIDLSKVELIRMSKAIEKYGLCRSSFDNAARAGSLQKYKRGKATFFDANQIDRWIIGESAAA